MANIYLHGEVVDDFLAQFGLGFSARMVIAALEEIPRAEPIDVYINSPGGSAMEAISIRNHLLKRNADAPVTTIIDGYAASAATVVMLGGSQIVAAEGARMMIHQPYISFLSGTAAELQMVAESLSSLEKDLAKLYAKKTGKPYARYLDLMNPGKFYSAEEALKEGFVDKIDTNVPVKDMLETSVYARLAKNDHSFLNSAARPFQKDEWKAKLLGDLSSSAEELERMKLILEYHQL